ncbi:MAG TPA: hypothetical protein PLW14_11420 [Chlorobiota bacterium]|nr:hypothetical protein [Chlorobiota bacterium]
MNRKTIVHASFLVFASVQALTQVLEWRARVLNADTFIGTGIVT